MNTKEHKWLAYGPGLLEGGAIGSPTEFIIQARNNNDEIELVEETTLL